MKVKKGENGTSLHRFIQHVMEDTVRQTLAILPVTDDAPGTTVMYVWSQGLASSVVDRDVIRYNPRQTG